MREERYGVFIDGVIGPHLLPIYLDELRPAARARAVRAADAERSRTTIDRVAPARIDSARCRETRTASCTAQFDAYGAFAGWSIDNSSMTADQTADVVMEACGRGDCLVWSPALAHRDAAAGRDRRCRR